MPGLREGLFLDDVMLLPRRSEVSASDVSLESRLSTNVVRRSPFVTSARQPATSRAARWSAPLSISNGTACWNG
jgi:IMP dehydrogenase/GMP reductase